MRVCVCGWYFNFKHRQIIDTVSSLLFEDPVSVFMIHVTERISKITKRIF